jgi:hypothetical protein
MAAKRERPKLTPDPLVVQLESAAGGEPIVQLAGYLGSEAEGKVRLYLDLSLTEFIDVDRDDILHAKASKEPEGRSILFLPAKARVRRGSMTMQDAGQVAAGGVPGILHGPWDLFGHINRFFDPCADLRKEVRLVRLIIARIREKSGGQGIDATIISIWEEHLAGLEWALKRCEENAGLVAT